MLTKKFLLKDEKKEKILPLCKHVTCGNQYLANFAKKFNANVTIIPSTVDTDKYIPLKIIKTKILKWLGRKSYNSKTF